MPAAYWISVTTHLLAAFLWLGGMFFLAVVGAPVLRSVQPDELRQRLFHQLGARFRTAGWWAIATLVVTGVLNLYYRGLLAWDGVLANPAFWNTPVGRALAAKLAAVTIMIASSAVHDFVLGPATGRATAGTAEYLRLRRRSALLARFTALTGVVLVVVGVRLARGG